MHTPIQFTSLHACVRTHLESEGQPRVGHPGVEILDPRGVRGRQDFDPQENVSLFFFFTCTPNTIYTSTEMDTLKKKRLCSRATEVWRAREKGSMCWRREKAKGGGASDPPTIVQTDESNFIVRRGAVQYNCRAVYTSTPYAGQKGLSLCLVNLISMATLRGIVSSSSAKVLMI